MEEDKEEVEGGSKLGEGRSTVVICNCYSLEPCYAVTIPN